MKDVWRIVVLMLCTLLLCSCADSVEDGVLIVPSSRNLYEETSAVVTASAETEDIVPQTEPPAAAEIPMAESVSEQVNLLFGDEVFCDLLAQYGEQLDAQAAAVAAVLAYQQLRETVPKPPETEDAVFWTVSGSVWHVTAECSALAKSKSVLSGTEEQAKQAGKSRVCKRCGS